MLLVFAFVGIAVTLLFVIPEGGGLGIFAGAVLGSLGSTAKSSSSANIPEKYISPGLDELLRGSKFKKSSKKGLGRLETKGCDSLVPPWDFLRGVVESRE